MASSLKATGAHLLRKFHGGRERLRVIAENVLEVYVEEAAVGGEHQVIQMPVADT